MPATPSPTYVESDSSRSSIASTYDVSTCLVIRFDSKERIVRAGDRVIREPLANHGREHDAPAHPGVAGDKPLVAFVSTVVWHGVQLFFFLKNPPPPGTSPFPHPTALPS